MGVLVLGAGGHGKVVADVLQVQGIDVTGFLDDDPDIWGSSRLGLPVLGAVDKCFELKPDGLVLGIGSNSIRKKLVERLGKTAEPLWINAIHPTATISRTVQLGHGVVLAAHSVVNPDVCVGNHVILNTGATVDHDCLIEDFAHIAPGAHLAGNVKIGLGVLMGIGANSIPGRSIGAWAVVGAGATVTQDIPENVIAKGTPARW